MTEAQGELHPVLSAPGGRGAAVLRRWLSRRPSRIWVVVLSIGLLIGIAYVDWVTGPQTQFPFFYAIPVMLTAWFVGRMAGCLMAVASVGIWLYADLTDGSMGGHPGFAYSNTICRLLCLIPAVLLLCAFKDLSARLENMVNERSAALRKLAAQLSKSEDAERRRLAHDIHDGFNQMLSVLKLSLDKTRADAPAGNAQWNRIDEAIAVVNELIQMSRNLTFELHPVMLDYVGLAATIGKYGEQFRRQTSVEVMVHEEGIPRGPVATMGNYLFRAATELISNAAKHGKAKQVIVSLLWTPAMVRLIVDDDGTGFDSATTLAAETGRGLGLRSIRERLESLGGSFRVESSAGAGTRVVLEAPLKAEEANA